MAHFDDKSRYDSSGSLPQVPPEVRERLEIFNQETNQIAYLLAGLGTYPRLEQQDIALLRKYADGTFSGMTTINKEGEYATERKYYALPSIVTANQGLERYAELMEDFEVGPEVDPSKLSEAVDALATLGRTVVGVHNGPEGKPEEATTANILYVPGGGAMAFKFIV